MKAPFTKASTSVVMNFQSVKDQKHHASQQAAKHLLTIEYLVLGSIAPFFTSIYEANDAGDLPPMLSFVIERNAPGRVIHVAFALDNLKQRAAVTRWFVALQGGGA